MEITMGGKGYALRSPAKGCVAKVFHSCGVALPPTLTTSVASKPAKKDEQA